MNKPKPTKPTELTNQSVTPPSLLYNNKFKILKMPLTGLKNPSKKTKISYNKLKSI